MQERLLFRVERYVADGIVGWQPSEEALDYPPRLLRACCCPWASLPLGGSLTFSLRCPRQRTTSSGCERRRRRMGPGRRLLRRAALASPSTARGTRRWSGRCSCCPRCTAVWRCEAGCAFARLPWPCNRLRLPQRSVFEDLALEAVGACLGTLMTAARVIEQRKVGAAACAPPPPQARTADGTRSPPAAGLLGRRPLPREAPAGAARAAHPL